MTREQETAVLDKCIDLVERYSGKRPTGYVAPWWEFSNVTNELLLERGIKYDHSLMHHDFLPYYVRVGDSWTKIDYAKKAEEWMVPLQRGEETDLIEIPASWYLDDLPPMMFIKGAPNSHGFVNPRDIEQLWMDQFDWVYREYDYAVFAMTIHPDVSRPPRRARDARADHRAHQQALGHPLGDLRRDRRRLQGAVPAQLTVGPPGLAARLRRLASSVSGRSASVKPRRVDLGRPARSCGACRSRSDGRRRSLHGEALVVAVAARVGVGLGHVRAHARQQATGGRNVRPPSVEAVHEYRVVRASAVAPCVVEADPVRAARRGRRRRPARTAVAGP